MVIRSIQKKELTEYLDEDINKRFYNYYYKYLKPKYGVEIADLHKFFDEVYSIALIFKDNYQHTPYEVNEYIIREINNSDLSSICKKIKTIIKYEFIVHILSILHENILIDNNGEYIIDNQLRNVVLGETTTFTGEITILEEEIEKEIENPEGDNCQYWFSNVVINELYVYLTPNKEFANPKTKMRFREFFYSKISPSNKNIDNLHIINKSKDSTPTQISTLKWHGTNIDFIELTKALIENGTLKGKQKDIINDLSYVFGLDLKYPDKTINDLKKRNHGKETSFINKLKDSLYNFISRENIR